MAKSNKNIIQWRVREELKLRLLKTIDSFKSVEEPSYKKLTKEDIINILSSMIARKTE